MESHKDILNLSQTISSMKIPPISNEQKAEIAGYDCGMNGANTTNCHFSYLATPELTKAWEKGKKQAEEDKLKTENNG